MKYRLGDLISLSEAKNGGSDYDLSNLKGISIKKVFIETKADMTDVSLHNYLIVPPDAFAYVTITSRNGEKITIAHNDTDDTYIVSSSYVVFSVTDTKTLNSDYLYIYFNRPEFDRYARFNSWGSAREAFSWDDMCDIEIDLPPLPVQQKYVDVYNAMLANQRAYESGLEDLKITYIAYLEKLRKTILPEPIGKYIAAQYEEDTDGSLPRRGVSTAKRFVTPKQEQNIARKSQIVRIGQFAYNTATTRNGETLSIALCSIEDYSVPGIYQVFEVVDTAVLYPEYLFMWLCRSEFDRYSRFASYGSAHEQFLFPDMCDVKIPIPDIKVQKAIADIHTSYINRREINEKMKMLIKDICPILIKGSLEEAASA